MDVPAAIEQVVAELEPGGRVAGVRRLTGGVSANVFAADINTSDGAIRRIVCRQHPGVDFKDHSAHVTAKEYHLLSALHEVGLAVPQPLLYIEPPSTAPYLVMEWIDGSTEPPSDDMAGAMDEMARFLVELHSLDPSGLPLPELDAIEDPFAAIVPYLPQTDTGRAVATWLAADSSELRPNRPAVLHGDYWPGNVMWLEGRLQAVIDWEDAAFGDPLADLAAARLELRCQYGTDDMSRFTTRYLDLFREHVGTLSLDTLTIWELYASAAALATMGAWGLEPSVEAHRRHQTQEFFDEAARQLD